MLLDGVNVKEFKLVTSICCNNKHDRTDLPISCGY